MLWPAGIARGASPRQGAAAGVGEHDQPAGLLGEGGGVAGQLVEAEGLAGGGEHALDALPALAGLAAEAGDVEQGAVAVADAAVEMSQSLAQAVGGGEGVGGGLLDVGVGHAHHAGDGGGTGGVGAARTAEGQDQGVIGGTGEAAGLGVGQRWRRGHGGGRLQGGEGFAGAEVEVAFGDPAAAHAVGLDLDPVAPGFEHAHAGPAAHLDDAAGARIGLLAQRGGVGDGGGLGAGEGARNQQGQGEGEAEPVDHGDFRHRSGGPAAGAGVFCGSMTMICILVTPSYGAVVKRLTPAAIR